MGTCDFMSSFELAQDLSSVDKYSYFYFSLHTPLFQSHVQSRRMDTEAGLNVFTVFILK